MEEEDNSTRNAIIVGGVLVTGYFAGGVYQYSLWKDEAIVEAIAQGKTGATNVTRTEMEAYLAGTKMVPAFAGTPKAAPTGAVAAVLLPAKVLILPLLNLWKPFEA